MTHQIFVYGTLRPSGRYWPTIAEYQPKTIDASITGFDMYALPEGYPAIIVGAGTIVGTLLQFDDACIANAVETTDRIEECTEKPDALYCRETIEVPAHGKAFVYLFNDSVYARDAGEPIVSGDWFSR